MNKNVMVLLMTVGFLAGTCAYGDLIGYWKFDNDPNSNDPNSNDPNVYDETGVHNGTLPGITGDATFVEGHVDNALDVSPGPAGIECGNSSNAFFTGQALTVMAWIYPKFPIHGQGPVIGHMNDGGDDVPGDGMVPEEGWFFFHNPGGNAQTKGRMVLGATIDGTWGDTGSSITAVPANKWSHVAVTYDGTNCRYYFNGLPDGIVSSRPGTITPVTTSPIYLASEPGWDSIPFSRMIIDELNLYNEVLNDAAILAEYNLNPLPYPELTISANPAYINTVTPYVGVQNIYNFGEAFAISAPQYVDCDNNGEVRVFDHWEAVENVSITDLNAASTTAVILLDAPAELKAHYKDGRQCGDACHPIPVADLSDPKDCKVNLDDLRIMAQSWLDDTSPL